MHLYVDLINVSMKLSSQMSIRFHSHTNQQICVDFLLFIKYILFSLCDLSLLDSIIQQVSLMSDKTYT